jgi:hypothetical protein
MCDGALTVPQTNAVLNGCGKALYTKKLELECSRLAPGQAMASPTPSAALQQIRPTEFLLSGG